jgi:peptide/nickel transport system ATP-binding protein
MLLELDTVSKRYPGRTAQAPALSDVNLSLPAESPPILAIVGESGSGKSTLGHLALGFFAPTTGAVRYCGADLRHLGGAEWRRFRREVQAIPQDPFASYNPFYLVDHALEEPLRRFGLARNRGACRRMIEEACAGVGLNPGDTLGRYPHQLSGGQRQRLMVARALLLQPRLLIADEPVSMVDASLRATILGNIAELNRRHGIGILYITHDLTTAYHIADAVVVLYRGHVVEFGPTETVIAAPSHPYTQLLIDSIPWPDLSRSWGSLPLRTAVVDATHDADGCPFRARCPVTSLVCAQAPTLREAAAGHAVSCHLFDTQPPLDGAAQSALLRQPHRAGTSHKRPDGASDTLTAASKGTKP